MRRVPWRWSVPVSYTHLDVYKRQPENTAPARAVHAALDLARTGVSSRTVLRLSLIHI